MSAMFPEPYPCCDHCDWECVGELYGHTSRCPRLSCVGVRRPIAVPSAIILALTDDNAGFNASVDGGYRQHDDETQRP